MNNKDNRIHSLSRSFMRDYLAASVPSILLLVLISVTGFLSGAKYFTDMIGTVTRDLNQYAEQHLRMLGEDLIRNKARDTAKQVEIYLRSHPDISMQELQNNTEFRKIAVQPVGKTGYTAIHESHTGINRIHPNPSVINKPLILLSEKLPSFWAVLKQSLSGTEVSGYYDWIEPNRIIRQKYMTITPVGIRFRDTELMLASTTYIDEFSAPAVAMNAKADEIILRSREFVFRQSLIFGIAGLLVIFFMLITALCLARRAKSRYIQPVEQLASIADELGREKWDIVIPATVSDRNDEIRELGLAFQNMAAKLRGLFIEQEQRMNELIRAEAAVRENEIKFKSIYENTYDTIMLLTDSGFFDCNRRTLEMFGFSSKEELTSVHPADISPPNQPDGQDSMTASNERIQTAVQQGYCFFEWMHRRKNGEDFPADVILSSYQLGGKKIVQATVRDISERKRIESELHNRTEELRKSEEKYRSIFENAVEGIFQSVPGGGYLSVNPAFAKIFGYDSPQDVLASVTDVAKQLYVNPEDREELVRIIKENGMAEGFEIQLYRKDRS
ncbi:MAG: hypothetical protein BWK80_55755, partial [Desulfobacteraceae bacterium IS3]